MPSLGVEILIKPGLEGYGILGACAFTEEE